MSPHPVDPPRVVAVSRDELHRFSKIPVDAITLVAGLGIVGDAHAGTLVQPPGADAVHVIRKAGVMAVIEHGGDVRAGQPVRITLPDGPHHPLAPV